MNLDQIKICVTGGYRGIGLATAIHLQSKGATVIILDRDISGIDNVPDELEGYEVDVGDSMAVEDLFGTLSTRGIHIDCLVNCAGTMPSAPMVNLLNPHQMMLGLNEFQRCIKDNLESAFVVTSAFVEALVRRRSPGCIVNVSSICAAGNVGQTAYSAAKAGVNAMTVVWAKELGPLGIRANAVAPGFIDSPSTHKVLSERKIAEILERTPGRRLGNLQEVAGAVEFLIINEFVNGEILGVDGGYTL